MYSAKLVGNQMDTVFGLYLPEYEVPAPEVQTNYKEVPYRDGAIDKTAPDGVVSFKDREWSLSFQKTGEDVSAYDVPELSASLMNAIHGKSGEIIFDDDPNYKWVGRVFVENVQCENNGLIIANISLITQPYKYGIEDIVVTDTIETEEDEYQGSIVSFEGGLGKELTKLLAHIEPTQDLHGYDHPWPAGGGKNVMPNVGNSTTFQDVTLTYNSDDSTYTLNGSTTAAGNIPLASISTALMKWVVGNGYTLSCRVVSGSFTLGEGSGITYAVAMFNSSNSSFIRGGTRPTESELDGYTCTGNAFSSTGNYQLMLQCWRVGTVFNNLKIRIQIEAGSSATSWTPYSNICPISGLTGLSVYVSTTQDPDDATVYNVDWTTQAGTVYHGTVDPVAGQLTVDWVKKSASEATNWKNHTALSDGSGYYIYSPGFFPANGTKISNSHKQSFTGAWENMTFGEFYGSTSAVVTVPPEANTLALAKTYLESIGTYFVYPLATPITYQLTPKQIAMLLGINNVWSDAGDVDVTISVFDMVTLSNGRKPQSPKISVVSEGEVTLMFFVKGTKHIINLAAGEWSVPDLMLFEGDTDVYESGEGTVTYTYKEASL